MLFDTTNNKPSVFDFKLSKPSPITFSGESGLKFKKQVIYVGKFGKYDPNTGKPLQEFDITPAELHHWAQSVQLQKARGIKIHVPLGHTDNPELSRGEIDNAFVSEDEQGRLSLFVEGTFNSAEAAEKAKGADVSIHSPPAWADGTGNTYVYPFRHLALTTEPVVPGLKGFEISASLSDKTLIESKATMASFVQLAKKFGVKLEDNATEEQAFKALEESGLVLPKEDDATGAGTGEGDTKKSVSFSLSDPKDKLLCNLTCESRTNRINKLVSAGKATPASAKKLIEKFATEKAVSFSLSGNPDGFESAIEALELLPSTSVLGEKTGKQVLNFSNSGSGEEGDNSEGVNGFAKRLAAKVAKK